MSVATVENISEEFGAAYRREFTDTPLVIEKTTEKLLIKRAGEYGPGLLLGIWIMYIHEPQEVHWGIDLDKFLKTKLQKWGAIYSNAQKRLKREEGRHKRDAYEGDDDYKPTNEEILQRNINQLIEIARDVPKDTLAEILFKTASHAWYWDRLEVPRHPQIDSPDIPALTPRNGEVMAKVDAIRQWREKGFIEWSELDFLFMTPTLLKGQFETVTPKPPSGFWSPSTVGGVIIRIGGKGPHVPPPEPKREPVPVPDETYFEEPAESLEEGDVDFF